MKKHILLFIFLLFTFNIFGFEWEENGRSIAQNDNCGYYVRSANLSDGNVIIVWNDVEDEYQDIFAQKIDSQGNTLFAEPVAIVNRGVNDIAPDIIAAEDNSFILSWNTLSDEKKFNIAKFDANFNRLWQHEFDTNYEFSPYYDKFPIMKFSNDDLFVRWYSKENEKRIQYTRITSNGEILLSDINLFPSLTKKDECVIDSNDNIYFIVNEDTLKAVYKMDQFGEIDIILNSNLTLAEDNGFDKIQVTLNNKLIATSVTDDSLKIYFYDIDVDTVNYVTVAEDARYCSSILIDTQNNFYLTYNGGYIAKYDETGELLWTWETEIQGAFLCRTFLKDDYILSVFFSRMAGANTFVEKIDSDGNFININIVEGILTEYYYSEFSFSDFDNSVIITHYVNVTDGRGEIRSLLIDEEVEICYICIEENNTENFDNLASMYLDNNTLYAFAYKNGYFQISDNSGNLSFENPIKVFNDEQSNRTQVFFDQFGNSYWFRNKIGDQYFYTELMVLDRNGNHLYETPESLSVPYCSGAKLEVYDQGVIIYLRSHIFPHFYYYAQYYIDGIPQWENPVHLDTDMYPSVQFSSNYFTITGKRIYRFTAEGELDPTWGAEGVRISESNSDITRKRITPLNEIVLVYYQQNDNHYIAKFNLDGSIDYDNDVFELERDSFGEFYMIDDNNFIIVDGDEETYTTNIISYQLDGTINWEQHLENASYQSCTVDSNLIAITFSKEPVINSFTENSLTLIDADTGTLANDEPMIFCNASVDPVPDNQILFTDSNEILINWLDYRGGVNRCSGIYSQKLDLQTVSNDGDDIQSNVNSLEQNYPNPFINNGRTETNIKFNLESDAHARVEIFNVKGQKVKTLTDTKMKAGMHQVKWDGRNHQNKNVSSGVYLYKLSVDGEDVKTNKCLLMK